MLTRTLLWLDQSPAHYHLGAFLAFGVLVFFAVGAPLLRAGRSRWGSPLLFALALGLAVAAFRWPALADNREILNPDESSMMAGAITSRSRPVFWGSVDGTTHGPLVIWPLTVVGWLGGRIDYTNTRAFSSLLLWVTLAATWLALRRTQCELASRMLLPGLVLATAGSLFFDFAQYSSEQVPVALLAAAVALLARALLPATDRRGGWTLGAAGLLLGALPFAKLQAVPIGLVLATVALGLLACDRSVPAGGRMRLIAAFVGGALLVPGLMGLTIFLQRTWSDFWAAYILNNLVYTGSRPLEWAAAPAALLELIRRSDGYPAYVFPLLGLLGAGLVAAARRWRAGEGRLLLLAFGLFAAALYAVALPNRPYGHYLQFLTAPLTLLVGALLGRLFAHRTESVPASAHPARPLLPSALAFAVLAVTCGAQIHFALGPRPLENLGRFTSTRGQLVRSELGTFVRRVSRPNDAIAIWGWRPKFLVEANRPHATRESNTERQIDSSGMSPLYRQRYLDDLDRANPPLFVDVVGPGAFVFNDRANHAHEIIPALAERIASRYRLLADLDSARVYVRRDRYAEAAALLRAP